MEIRGTGNISTLTRSGGIDENSKSEFTPSIGLKKTQQTQTENKDNRPYEDKSLSEEDVIGIIEKANKDFIVYDRKFEFSIHEKTKQIMVKVIDANNDEVIRELPPEKVLDMVAAMWEVAGIIIDKKI